jgi:hypothetical protein
MKVLPDGGRLPSKGGKINTKTYEGQDVGVVVRAKMILQEEAVNQILTVSWFVQDFMKEKITKDAGLTEIEVVVVRLYTGPMYSLYNRMMRQILKELEAKVQLDKAENVVMKDLLSAATQVRKETKPKFVSTMHALGSAIIKIRKLGILPEDLTVVRGLAGLDFPDKFKYKNHRGGCLFLPLGCLLLCFGIEGTQVWSVYRILLERFVVCK